MRSEANGVTARKVLARLRVSAEFESSHSDHKRARGCIASPCSFIVRFYDSSHADACVRQERAIGTIFPCPLIMARVLVLNPVTPTNKKGTFVYQKFLFCLSIAKAMAYHHALACISSPQAYIINRRLYSFRNDDIQCSALMIYRNRLRMIYKAIALMRLRQERAIGAIPPALLSRRAIPCSQFGSPYIFSKRNHPRRANCPAGMLFFYFFAKVIVAVSPESESTVKV